MSATEITVTGNVVASPTRVRTQNGAVTNFRVASTERRYDAATGTYVDGSSFFVDVECWNELGANVASSVSKGDPVVVRGLLRTEEWETEKGRGSRPRIRARAVGLDLSRGTAEFRKTQRSTTAAPPVQEAVDEALREALDGTPEDEMDGRDYSGPSEPLYELDPDSSAGGTAHGALPEPALH
ncbi:single-stranded DNA-binding protein [Geodermatophilus sp. FMUSA9-8]|uniref:single-stranded DNA-binding protein n=1 Tax=Geodermatophilus sp. FMUSA9-8 TaxID=3120155 RepID=UPI00300B8520